MTHETTAVAGPHVVERTTGDLKKAAVSGWLGTAMEFMDFQLYSLAAAIVFNEIFFPDIDPAMGLIAAMATYGVGYVARLAGAIYFGRMGDRIGRKKVLFLTIALMGAATTLIGVLPTYAQIGLAAPILLVVLRLAQGFGAGAEIAGATTMLAEYAPTKRRGVIASLVSLGTNTGTLAATGLWAILLAVLTEEQLLSWGWRLPFLFSFVLMIFAIWIRTHLKESPVFEGRADVTAEGVALTRARARGCRRRGEGGQRPRGRPQAAQGQGLLHRPGPALRPGRQLRPHPDLPRRLPRHHAAARPQHRHERSAHQLRRRVRHRADRRSARRPVRTPADLHGPDGDLGRPRLPADRPRSRTAAPSR